MPAPHRRRPWWIGWTLPFGLTTWAAFLYLGIRTRKRPFIAVAVGYAALLVAAIALLNSDHHDSLAQALGTVALLVVWIGGFVHALCIRRSVEERLEFVSGAAIASASHEIARRNYGRELLRTKPELARQLGVGRPDLPNCDSFGLVDVNHAGAAALASLPGMDRDSADKVAEFCQAGGSFVNADDLALFLDLPPARVDALRELTVFDRGA